MGSLLSRSLTAILFFAVSATLVSANTCRQSIDLNGTWLLAPDPCNTGETGRWQKPEHTFEKVGSVTVPADFSALGDEYKTYKGAAWYRRSFTVPATWKDKRVVIRFEAVNNQSKVWINGRFAGQNPDPFLPFEFDVSRLIEYGAENTVTVKADTTNRPDAVPSSRIGWFPFGGIIRPVSLIATNKIYITSPHICGQVGPDGASLRLTAVMHNETREAARVRISTQIQDSYNTLLHGFGIIKSIGPHTKSLTQSNVTIQAPVLLPWSCDRPILYTAQLSLYANDKLVDDCSITFGLRTIEARGGTLYLNGEPIILTGFNRHEDSPRTNMCPDLNLVREELLQMKTEFGANFVRLAHYPQSSEILDICDQIGMLVMTEVPLYMWKGIAESGTDYHKKFESASRQLDKMINRDYNHPSVIIWSVSNETWPKYLEVAGANTKLVAQAKRTDPTRLALHVSDHWRPDLPDGRSRQDHFGEDDIIAINGYPHQIFRKNNGNPLSSWHDDVAGARIDPNLIARFWADGIKMLHEEYPHKPILVSEFGWRSDSGHKQQAMFIEGAADGMKHPALCGATVWCWADHPWDSEEELRISPYGIYARERRAKPQAVRAAKELFTELRNYFDDHRAK